MIGCSERLGRLLGFALLVATGVACGSSVHPLEHARSTPTELASAVLEALERRDEAALRSLALSEQEFREHVWPDLPASRPERNLSLEYVWQDLRQKSDAGLVRTLATQGGRRYHLEDLQFRGGTTQYGTFKVHRESVAVLVDETGTRTEAHLFGSVLEKDGSLKVFSFVVD